MSAPSFRTVTIPAGSATNPGIITEQVTGRFYATVSTTGLFYVRANQGAQIEQNAGRRFGTPDAQEFSRLAFFNYTALALTVTYYAGATEFVPDPSVLATISTVSVTVSSTVQNKATYTKGSTGAVAGGAGTAFSGLNGADVRKSLSVFNNEIAGSGNNILVVGANGTAGHVVTPQTSYVVESAGAINITGAGFAYYVMEVFYSP